MIFYPLWTVDVSYLHKRHDDYLTGRRADGKWIYTTNNAFQLPN